jgi:hypothetical protein
VGFTGGDLKEKLNGSPLVEHPDFITVDLNTCSQRQKSSGKVLLVQDNGQ